MRRWAALLAAFGLVAACAGSADARDDERPAVTPDPAPTTPPAPGLTPTPTPPPPTSAPEPPTPTPEPVPSLSWGPTPEQYDEAAALVAAMSIDEQAGQVIVAKYGGTAAPTDLVERLHLGGVIVMPDNVESPDQIQSVTTVLAEANTRPYPLVISVDQEGGRVARIRTPATEFPSLMTLGAARNATLAAEVAKASGDELRAMGFTMVFAPDADVTTGPDDPTIGTRSVSSDPALVSVTIAGALRGYDAAGIIPVAKHFPGHGSVPADSHQELPVQTASVAELAERDFLPFRRAVAAGVPAVMVAHINVEAVDPGVPSSLSPKVIGLLRDELGFEGVVITDAQDMAAITAEYGSSRAAVQALAAGADILLMPRDTEAAIAGIVDAVAGGDLPVDRLAEAATRVVAMMLHQAASNPAPDAGVVGSNGAVSYDATLAGITIASGPCEGRLVGDAIQVVGGNKTDRDRLTRAAERAGLTVGAGDVVRLIASASPGTGDVVVSLDTPYVLGSSEATTARIALYGRTPEGFRALVDVLTGEAVAGGRLPVGVPGLDQNDCD